MDKIFATWIVGLVAGTICVAVSIICPWWVWVITCLISGMLSRYVIRYVIWQSKKVESRASPTWFDIVHDEGNRFNFYRQID